MAKPIFVIELPATTEHKIIRDAYPDLVKLLSDWHVLLTLHNGDEVMYHAFYDKDAIDVDIEKLQEMIFNRINDAK